jgi:eukaryotic-like serine/threonine-protein kinase
MSLSEGATALKYRIGRKLGAGAFGVVWMAQDLESGDPVAIKVLLKPASSPGDHVARFKREAENLRRIQSDYVAKLIDFVDDPEHGLMIVMEYIEGDLLTDVLLETSLSLPEAIELGIHISQGLVDMHGAGVIHRDVKPSNIMIRPLETGRQRAVIFDLGLSRFSADVHVHSNEPSSMDVTATAAKVALGTPAFMAPEQVLDAKTATAASDVYAAGVVLFLAASGRFPFEGEEREIARKKILEEAPKLELGRIDRLTLQYAKVIGKAVKRRPEERYQRASELHDELLALRDLAATMPPPRAVSLSPYPPTVEAQKPWTPAMPVSKSSGMLPAFMMQPESASRSQPPLLVHSDGTALTPSRPKFAASGWGLALLIAVFLVALAAWLAYAVT